MAVTNIINRDGTTIAIGAGAYSNCVIRKSELTDEYMGRQEYRLTIHSDIVLPIYLGARCFSSLANGAGGFILLEQPTKERQNGNYFIYDLKFAGFSQQLETVLLFNQDAVGYGWETNFSLYGTAADFIDLICRNMNRTQPTDSQLELWKAGTVDTTGTSLISFDNDNCLTALKKVSETFELPYKVEGEGGFQEYWVGISITSVKRRHTHVYDIGNGLAKIKTVGDTDKKFTTALCAQGSTRNIPYNYRGGLKRLHCGSIGTTYVDTVYDEATEWQPTMQIVPDGATIDFYNETDPQHGTVCTRITSADALYQAKIRFTRASAIDVSGSTLRFWISGGAYFNWSPAGYYYFDLLFYGDSGFLGIYRVYFYSLQYETLTTEGWLEVVIPMSAVSLSLGYSKIRYLELQIGVWSHTTANGAEFGLDNMRFDFGISDNTLQNFILGTSLIAQHGRMELAVINDDIYPELLGEITTVVSETKFIDTNIPFDLNAKDSEGNTTYLIDQVTPKINFTSGNLSGYSLAIHNYKHATKEFELVPYTEESGNIIPGAPAYLMQVGDKYNITEIQLPDAYIEAAEQRLYTWALAEFEKYSAANEIAEIELDNVWLEDIGNLYSEMTDAPGDLTLLYKPDRLYMAGDLLRITVPGFYDRELIVQTVIQDRTEPKTTYRLTLANDKKANITGEVLMNIRKHKTALAEKTERLAKYFDK